MINELRRILVKKAVRRAIREKLTPSSTVRLLRQTAALTQTELAHAIGTTQPRISSIEAGRKVTPRMARRLAKVFGVHPGEIAFSNWKAGRS
jgi:plasmid maintenance system antidote protein VapI